MYSSVALELLDPTRSHITPSLYLGLPAQNNCHLAAFMYGASTLAGYESGCWPGAASASSLSQSPISVALTSSRLGLPMPCLLLLGCEADQMAPSAQATWGALA